MAAIRAGTAGELVWLVEHPPLYTAGTSARPEELTAARPLPDLRRRARRAVDLSRPGPAHRLRDAGPERAHGRVRPRDVRCFVWGLEEWLIRALDRFGVRGERRDGRVGIWVADRAAGTEAKIAAIGVRVTPLGHAGTASR